jgi:lipopolysaccharide cholinephosphotransferase
MRFEEKDVQWYCNIYSKYTLEKESIKSEWVKELVRVPFEDGEFPIVKNYDAYLTHLYGDYMTPPQEKDRVPVHI